MDLSVAVLVQVRTCTSLQRNLLPQLVTYQIPITLLQTGRHHHHQMRDTSPNREQKEVQMLQNTFRDLLPACTIPTS
jgi:hypothetical protein